MFNTYFYNSSVRSLIVAFGELFSDLTIVRTDSNDTVIQTLPVPIAYGPRDKWLTRTDTDPDLKRNVMNILPRMAFTLIGLQYDGSRKLNMNEKIRFSNMNINDPTKMASIFTPVPYNFTMQLDILAKSNNDALQIVEQILPYFTPHYNITIKPMPGTDLIQDVPVVLNDVQFIDTYEQDWAKQREIIYTLLFTMKSVVYGGIGKGSIIKNVTANVQISGTEEERYNAYISPSSANIYDNYAVIENWLTPDIQGNYP